MKINGSQIIIKYLEKMGIKHVAGIPGGANLPLYDALAQSNIKHILARHEQGAGFIAHGIARSTGNPAVCFATSGPGATNLLTAIADAKLDSIPIIAITGQVSSSYMGTDAFQEVDTYGMSIPITKHNFLVKKTEDLLYIMPEAFRIAISGRPGPVWIDVPKDIQKEIIEIGDWPENKSSDEMYEIENSKINYAVRMIEESKKPILYIGGGIISSESSELIYQLSEKNSIPVVSTLMGLGSLNDSNDKFMGMLGMHGARHTNMIMNEADLLIAFGVRFDDRATGKVNGFCEHAKILHIDIDASEINKIKESNFSITCDIKHALEKLVPLISSKERKEWIAFINKTKMEYPSSKTIDINPLNPLNIIKSISEIIPYDAIITTDVGQHQMWTAQSYPFRYPRTFLTSGGLGTMGFGLPAAIGAALANPNKKVICISGDGSILMNIQELATLAEEHLNIAVIIMNNKCLGLVRQQQELFYEKAYIASSFDFNPDFCIIAEGFGINSYDLETDGNIECILSEALSESKPCIINAPIKYSENVFPIVPPGASNSEMIGG